MYHAVYEKFRASSDEKTTHTQATTRTSAHGVRAKSGIENGRNSAVPIAIDRPVITRGEYLASNGRPATV